MTSENIEDRMEGGHRDLVDTENKENMVYRKVIFEPIRIGPVSTLDEMDGKVLQFQNKKLLMVRSNYSVQSCQYSDPCDYFINFSF